MTDKQKNSSDSLFDSGDNLFDTTEIPTHGKIFLSGFMTSTLIGTAWMIGSGAGLVIDETVMPPSSDPRPGQKIALTQYDRMFNTLAEQREILDQKRMEFSSLASIGNTPEMLSTTIGLSEQETEIYSDVNLARNEIRAAEGALSDLSRRFAKSAIIDKRLNESDVRDLFNRFENDIGSLEVKTGLKKPDFADLDQSRAAMSEKIFTSESEKALAVKNHSREINSGIATSILGKTGAGLAFGLVMLLLAAEYKGSNRYKSRRKPKGLKH